MPLNSFKFYSKFNINNILCFFFFLSNEYIVMHKYYYNYPEQIETMFESGSLGGL